MYCMNTINLLFTHIELIFRSLNTLPLHMHSSTYISHHSLQLTIPCTIPLIHPNPTSPTFHLQYNITTSRSSAYNNMAIHLLPHLLQLQPPSTLRLHTELINNRGDKIHSCLKLHDTSNGSLRPAPNCTAQLTSEYAAFRKARAWPPISNPFPQPILLYAS